MSRVKAKNMHENDGQNSRPSPNGSGRIRDVAREAGVSTATVSRTFNRPDSVKHQTLERVFEAARKLNYIPDSAARAMGSKVSRRIGVLIPTIDDSIFTRFIGALQQRLSKDRYTLLVGVYDFDPEYEANELHSLIESGVDGVVLCGARRSNDLYELLQGRNIPFVNASIYSPESPYPSVGPDFRSAAKELTRYLLDFGHRKIGFIDLASDTNDRAALRLAGIVDALEPECLSLPNERHIERPLSFEDGRIGLRTLLEYTPDLTAVICGNDVFAIGALFEAKDLDISVPGELSIVGFDNLELSAQISPGLTTVNFPTAEMGARVAEKLLMTLMGKPTPHAIHIETNLIIRGSSGPYRGLSR
ncbi:MAG: LacI family DNA-binding transcriptional regulator [Rhizobiales bacterium]|nr:LacI family DNA-binding transcriptional regulator [Hyphomicrobiales bacterium]